MCLLRLCLAVAIRQGECRADPKATIRMPINNNQPHRCSRQSVPRQPHLQKSRSPLCVLVGAFPGAVPPLIGWAAASGRLSIEAGVLYAMLFLWQFPHYMANCVDVPRRLRSRRLFGSAEGQRDGSVHDVGNSVARCLLAWPSPSCNVRHGTRLLFTVQWLFWERDSRASDGNSCSSVRELPHVGC
jgi:hypothetical protein